MANDLKLKENHPLSKDLRQVKIGEESSSLELSNTDNGARIRGDLEVVGNTKTTIDEMSFNTIPAYSGMVLAYRMQGESGTHTTYTLTSSYAVTDADHVIRFTAPPSGAVEIMVQIFHDASTSNRTLYFGLSDNSTYNSIGNSYEQIVGKPDETDDRVIQFYWVVTELTPGNAYAYWLGAKASATTAYLRWGGTATGRYCDFIFKATALPPGSGVLDGEFLYG